MKRLLFFLLLVPLVAAACGGDPSPPTGDPVATPIPTAPAAARPTYSVQRGTVEETLDSPVAGCPATSRTLPLR